MCSQFVDDDLYDDKSSSDVEMLYDVSFLSISIFALLIVVFSWPNLFLLCRIVPLVVLLLGVSTKVSMSLRDVSCFIFLFLFCFF